MRPSVMAFSRQGMPNLPGTSKEGVLKGGYIVHGGDAKPDCILLATGARPCSGSSWEVSRPSASGSTSRARPCMLGWVHCGACRALVTDALCQPAWAQP